MTQCTRHKVEGEQHFGYDCGVWIPLKAVVPRNDCDVCTQCVFSPVANCSHIECDGIVFQPDTSYNASTETIEEPKVKPITFAKFAENCQKSNAANKEKARGIVDDIISKINININDEKFQTEFNDKKYMIMAIYTDWGTPGVNPLVLPMLTSDLHDAGWEVKYTNVARSGTTHRQLTIILSEKED